MSYNEGTNYQAKREDEGKKMYDVGKKQKPCKHDYRDIGDKTMQCKKCFKFKRASR